MSQLAVVVGCGVGSGGQFDDRRTGGTAVAAPSGAPGGVPAGFWWRGGGAEAFTKLPKPPADTVGGQLAHRARALPRQALVGDDRPGEAQLGGGEHEQPRPTLGGGRLAHPQGRPAQALFAEPQGMLNHPITLRLKQQLR